ncbi:hypothetical protein NLM33_02185 [Bradyrhizobium sp. CCGUVB1N3]|uniref:hypothetical protein n=1 Tax=Bradyrhizobium sp. CCGUVB1N3 TaxID=2949629 RepID=UPI0020B3B13B|nr:hypothetical protein [Bradyrhizobium sp. CCGUVB1N3]MCP3469131.1 hypothetical protein [Bradyrhizobium sp. CCGUVB1N3]
MTRALMRGSCANACVGISFPRNGRSRGNSGPPVENHPKVDEKAYNAALDRIPVPTEKYDPWGGARAADPARPPKKSN